MLNFSSQGGVKSISLEQGPIYLGSAYQCQINFGTNNPPIKAVIQYFEDPEMQLTKVLFSSLDPQLKLHFNDRPYDQILLTPDEIVNIEIDQISISNSELVGITIDPLENLTVMGPPSLPSYKLPEEFVAYAKKASVEPNQNVDSKSKEIIEQNLEKSVAKVDVSDHSNVDYEVNDGTMVFNTLFKEEKFKPIFEIPFLEDSYQFIDYIDPDDETVVHLPETDIAKENKGKSVHITHLNNGVVLNEQFFSMELKRLSLSRNKSSTKSFQVHDLEERFTEFIFIQNNKVFIDEISGFEFQKYHPESGLDLVEDHSYELEYENERVVFTKGTSQIIVRITDTPPELESGNLFDLDDLLIKCVVGLWVIVSVPLLMVMLFVNIDTEPVKKTREIVVVYKRKKAEVEVQTIKVKQTSSKAPNKVIVNKKPRSTITINSKKKNIKKIVKEKKILTKNTKIVKRKKTKVIAKNSAPRKVKTVKSYTFNTASMIKSVRSRPTSTAKDIDSVNSSFNEVVGKSKYKMKEGIKSLDAKRSKVTNYGKNSIKGLKSTFGVRGISSKTNTTTSYQKTSTKILGAVDPELIRKLLREYIPHFRHCYQKELIRNPNLSGIFDLDFQITSKGRGSSLRITNSKTRFTNNGLGCLKSVIKKIKFPRPRGGGTVDVVQPLNFYSQIL